MPESKSGIKHEIHGTTMQTVVLTVFPGHKMYSESGGPLSMSANMKMESSIARGNEGAGLGGMLKALGGAALRAVSGESVVLNYYELMGGPYGLLSFAPGFPGKIIPFELADGQSIICQRGSFLVAENSVNIKVKLTQKIGAGFFGGEGFVLQEVTGPGLAMIELDGELVEYNLEAGQVMLINAGNFACMDASVSYDFQFQSSIKNILLSGAGLGFLKCTGPGRIWVQSTEISKVAKKLIPYLPTSSNN